MRPARGAAEEGEAPLLGYLGQRVRTLRDARGLTRRALAERSGLSERFVAELEAGRANISVLNLDRVARALGATAVSLLEGAPAQGPGGVISLLGLRGAGKSTVGKGLAGALGVPFFELDRLVEAEAGMRLSEIFAIHGEDYFRRQELAALERFLGAHRRAVLATGGGIVMSPGAFRTLLEGTWTVWLKALPEEHWARVVEQGDMRPMENRPHAMAELRRRLKEREPLYARAHQTVSTSQRSVDDVVAEVLSAAGLSPGAGPG
jgi:XRE family aerobic/anaerobic benzoate catabolism transcriptional regulator